MVFLRNVANAFKNAASTGDSANLKIQAQRFETNLGSNIRNFLEKGPDGKVIIKLSGIQDVNLPDVDADTFLRGFKNDPEGIAEDLKTINEAIEASRKLQSSNFVTKSTNQKTNEEQLLEKFQELQSRIDSLDPNSTKTWYNRILEVVRNNGRPITAGLGASGMAIHAHIVHQNTDGVTANITKLTINSDATEATVTFDLPNGNVLFQPAKGDTITFNNTSLENGNDYNIIEIVNDTEIKVSLSSLTNNGFLTSYRGGTLCQGTPPACSGVPGSPAPSPTFTCHSDFGNQFLSNWREFVRVLARGIGEGLGIVIDEAGNVLDDVSQPLINLATVGLNAGKSGFCSIVPICNGVFWLIFLLIIIGGIILFVVK